MWVTAYFVVPVPAPTINSLQPSALRVKNTDGNNLPIMRLYGQCCQLDLVVVQAGTFCGSGCALVIKNRAHGAHLYTLVNPFTGRAITQIVFVKFRHADRSTCLADTLTCVAGAVDFDLDRAADLRMHWQQMQLSIFLYSHRGKVSYKWLGLL